MQSFQENSEYRLPSFYELGSFLETQAVCSFERLAGIFETLQHQITPISAEHTKHYYLTMCSPLNQKLNHRLVKMLGSEIRSDLKLFGSLK